jgi:hypothetical protein
MTLTADYLRLTGDPLGADELELATFNGGLGAQHPSGRWWAYNTPMDGAREASAHTIVFQARAGTPELNCCSVNGPRVLGLLSEWAVMSAPDGLAINSYLPGSCALAFAGRAVRLELDQDYPRTNSQRVRLFTSGDKDRTLRLRIPAWSANTRVHANFENVATHAAAGSFLEIRRRWRTGDEVVLEFDFGLRAVAGANEAAGKVSLYRGPLLLAYDQSRNRFDEDKLPAVNLARLGEARLVSPLPSPLAWQPRSWVLLDLPVDAGGVLRLVDFADAGAAGTRYRSWLSVVTPLPPPAFTQYPPDAGSVRPGPVRFQWREPRGLSNVACRLEIATCADFSKVLLKTNCPAHNRLDLDLSVLPTATGRDLWWRVVTRSPGGETTPEVPPARFRLAAEAPAQVLPLDVERGATLALLMDGHTVGSGMAPEFTNTTARDCALGANPHFDGNEFLAGTFSDLGLWGRALAEWNLLS